MRKTSNESFIDAYLRYTQDQEAPTLFHKWTAILAVSAMLGRRCWIDRKFYILYPNLYILLMSRSGRGKKDTCIDIGIDVFLKKCPTHTEIFPGKLSGSKLLGRLSELSKRPALETGEHLDSTLLILAPELKAFLGPHPQNEEVITLLTALFKCPADWEYGTRKYGDEKLTNVCVNLLAGSTVKWLKTGLPPSAIGGGFTGRVIIVYAEHYRSRKADPRLPKNYVKLAENLISDLTEIGMMAGLFQVDREGWEAVKNWYERGNNELNYGDEDVLGPYFERKLDHILKVGMALSAMDGDQRIVTFDHLMQAKHYLEDLEWGATEVLRAVELNPVTEKISKVLEIIARAGSISRVKLLRKIGRWGDASDLNEAIVTLTEGGYIKEERVHEGPGPSRRVYIFISRHRGRGT